MGGWVRVAGSYQPELFPLLFAGQTLCAICQCFIFSAPNVIAAVWFPDQERTLCVSIAIILNQLGSAVCTILIVSVHFFNTLYLTLSFSWATCSLLIWSHKTTIGILSSLLQSFSRLLLVRLVWLKFFGLNRNLPFLLRRVQWPKTYKWNRMPTDEIWNKWFWINWRKPFNHYWVSTFGYCCMLWVLAKGM